VLLYREYLPNSFTGTLYLRLSPLFAPNSGEGFPKVRIDASGVMKGMIEDRFHVVLICA